MTSIVAGARSSASRSIVERLNASVQAAAPKAAAKTSAAAQVTLSAAARAAADYTDTIKKTGNNRIDALLAGGDHWFHAAGGDGSQPSSSARNQLTYSFIENTSGLNATDANGFQPLSASQRDAVRQALQYISTVANVSFTEVASGGDISYGANTQANSAGYARYPNDGSQVLLAKNQSTFSEDWSAGSYEWETVLHETGHALGLKHPGNYNAGGGGAAGPYLSKSDDNRNNTIMSYSDASNTKRVEYEDGSFQSSHVNPDTYQSYDIAALQYLYGAPTSQARTFSWDSGEAMSQTIFNNNADSRIDLSNQSGKNIVDLRAGNKSSIGIRDPYADMPYSRADYAKLTANGRRVSAVLGTPTYTGQNNLTIAKGSTINAATGGSGSDVFIGNGASMNTLDGGGGNDQFFVGKGNADVQGGDGTDVVYLATRSGYTWKLSDDHAQATLTHTDARTHQVTTAATVTLEGVEQVRLWNGSALKAAGKALYAATAGSAKPARAKLRAVA